MSFLDPIVFKINILETFFPSNISSGIYINLDWILQKIYLFIFQKNLIYWIIFVVSKILKNVITKIFVSKQPVVFVQLMIRIEYGRVAPVVYVTSWVVGYKTIKVIVFLPLWKLIGWWISRGHQPCVLNIFYYQK